MTECPAPETGHPQDRPESTGEPAHWQSQGLPPAGFTEATEVAR